MRGADHNDDRTHQALAALGDQLPEPLAPQGVRERIAGGEVARAESNGASAAAGLVPRVLTPLLGAVAAAFAIASAILFVQNERLRSALAHAGPGAGRAQVVHAGETPPLIALSFYHERCPIAGAVRPVFERMKQTHCENEVLFVSLDVTEDKAAQAAKLACALDCDFVLELPDSERSSGSVVLADMRSREIIKTSHDLSGLPEIERALDEALLTCSTAPPRE